MNELFTSRGDYDNVLSRVEELICYFKETETDKIDAEYVVGSLKDVEDTVRVLANLYTTIVFNELQLLRS